MNLVLIIIFFTISPYIIIWVDVLKNCQKKYQLNDIYILCKTLLILLLINNDNFSMIKSISFGVTIIL